MADVSSSAATISKTDPGTNQQEKPQKARPEKPDESKYKEDLAQAEKEHAAAQAKTVRRFR